MRLLRADTEDLELEDVPEGSKPYAILSHRWLQPQEEVTYADIVAGKQIDTLRRKLGWSKLGWCRQQAIKDGLRYVWADTACIDKSSSQELTESINAMFRWYKGAECCYVYLHDMPDPVSAVESGIAQEDSSDIVVSRSEMDAQMDLPTEAHSMSRTPACNERTPLLPRSDRVPGMSTSSVRIEDAVERTTQPPKVLDRWDRNAFMRSEWFERAWTLQEMLASDKLRFYNKSWVLIGELPDLAADVAEITGVHEELLQKQRSLASYSIAQKMSWAAMRKSTKVEDRAYSLLGIMNVSIGIVYGEGNRAFLRLQEELLRASSDDSIFAFRPKQIEIERRIHHTPYMTASALLAESPDAFHRCGHIARATWHRGNNQHQPAMKEVIFRMRAKTQRQSAYVYSSFPQSTQVIHRQVILDCSFEDRPLTVMKLNLFAMPTQPNTFYVPKDLALTLSHLSDEGNMHYRYETFSVVRDPDAGSMDRESYKDLLLCHRKSSSLYLRYVDASAENAWNAAEEAFLISPGNTFEADLDVLVHGSRVCVMRIAALHSDLYVALESGFPLSKFTSCPLPMAFFQAKSWSPMPWKIYHCSVKRIQHGFLIAKAHSHQRYLGHLDALVVEIDHVGSVDFVLFISYRMFLFVLTVGINYGLFVLFVLALSCFIPPITVIIIESLSHDGWRFASYLLAVLAVPFVCVLGGWWLVAEFAMWKAVDPSRSIRR